MRRQTTVKDTRYVGTGSPTTMVRIAIGDKERLDAVVADFARLTGGLPSHATVLRHLLDGYQARKDAAVCGALALAV